MSNSTQLPATLGELRRSNRFSEIRLARRTVKDEMREHLIERLRAKDALFPGIVGYDDTVVPQIVNAVLSRHNFILLGLRGQAKSRILRALTTLLDESIPYIAGCEIRDNPYAPLCRACKDRRPDWRPRPHQSGAQRTAPLQRNEHPLRPAAARQSRHLRSE
jgi:magnesium chelatase subunit I